MSRLIHNFLERVKLVDVCRVEEDAKLLFKEVCDIAEICDPKDAKEIRAVESVVNVVLNVLDPSGAVQDPSGAVR